MERSKETIINPVTDGIFVVETYYLDREHYAACYLLVDNGEAAVIETNTNYAVPRILDGLDQLGLTPEAVKYVILTHIHLDHAGGAGELMTKLPNAQLVLHPRGKRHMIDPTKLIESVKEVYGEAKYKELYGDILPIAKDRVQTAEDGSSLFVGSRELEMYHMAGHAKHHITILDKTTATVFSGDNFGIGYPQMKVGKTRLVFPSTSPTQFEPEEALKTYKRIAELKPTRVLLTHYGALEDVESSYVQLKNWIHFCTAAAQKRYAEGLREQELVDALKKDIWGQFQKEISGARGTPLSDAETELLEIDTDINAQGLAYYIHKLNT